FDDYFWHHLVPEAYAEKHDISFGKAQEQLLATFRSLEKTLSWTDLDFWSRELDLDVPALKEQLRHLIDVHPHAEEFLKEMKRQGKHIHLLTNAHWKSVKLKFLETGIGHYFDSVVTSNELGAPKEDLAYWRMAQERVGFDPERSIFVDDTEHILYTARDFGIKYVVFKGRASSQLEPTRSDEFTSIIDFNELLEG
ncbi:MAG: HAD-IA family hydrolase, partial [Akkermansiaceae bacterium]|nr:HAD-IA family hydrolase [Akkermansiaceae bacterium]NIS12044.1 HAD-IA family hydrolase [Thermoplasmata archaeon]